MVGSCRSSEQFTTGPDDRVGRATWYADGTNDAGTLGSGGTAPSAAQEFSSARVDFDDFEPGIDTGAGGWVRAR